MTVGAALLAARRLGLARLDAQLLLAHVLAQPRAWVLAHDDAPLAEAAAQRYAACCAQRADGVPLAYLTGEREFHGLPLTVTPAVLVPRPETEHLVDWGLALLAGPLAARPAPAVADLGSGSGAIALALAAACPRAVVHGVERSADALAVARANAERHRLPVRWHGGDWWQPLAGERFDLVLSNPPYVAAADPHLAALRHEPLAALASGADGLDALRAIVGPAGGFLASGAWLLLEHGHDQADAVQRLLQAAGFGAIETRADLAGLPRCTGGRWPGAVTAGPV